MRVYEIQDGFGFDNLRLAERPDPEPAATQVVVELRAWSLNYRDLLTVNGLYNPKMKLPRVPLSDGMGTVVAVGSAVQKWKVGDRVAAAFMPGWISGDVTEEGGRSALAGSVDGMLAEQVALDQEAWVRIPNHLSDEEAACLPCAGVTAWNALVESGRVRPGDTVLLLGTGGVSIFALQFAKLAGARVLLTSSSDEKLERARSMGADETCNYRSNADWDKWALERTGGRGVDHVIEVGGAGTLSRSLKAVRMGGHVALIGVLAGPADFNPITVLMKGVRMQGIFVGSRFHFESMNRAIGQAKLRPVVDKVFPFDQAVSALECMASGSHFGKIVLKRD